MFVIWWPDTRSCRAQSLEQELREEGSKARSSMMKRAEANAGEDEYDVKGEVWL